MQWTGIIPYWTTYQLISIILWFLFPISCRVNINREQNNVLILHPYFCPTFTSLLQSKWLSHAWHNTIFHSKMCTLTRKNCWQKQSGNALVTIARQRRWKVDTLNYFFFTQNWIIRYFCTLSFHFLKNTFSIHCQWGILHLNL